MLPPSLHPFLPYQAAYFFFQVVDGSNRLSQGGWIRFQKLPGSFYPFFEARWHQTKSIGKRERPFLVRPMLSVQSE